MKGSLRWVSGLLVAAACTDAATSDGPDAGSNLDASVALDAGAVSDAPPFGDGAAVDASADADAGRIDPWNPPLDGPVAAVATYDGWETPRFVSPPVNVDGGWTDSVAVTSDPRRLLFAYSRVDFNALYSQSQTSITGPARPGMTVDDFRIFQADLTPTSWNVSYHPVNSPDPNYAEASASLNAAQDLMVFTRWAHDGGFTGDLYYSSLTSGSWSASAPIGINSPCNDDNGFVVGSLATGVTLYFESDRVDAAGTTCGTKKHLFVATYADGGFSPVVRVPGIGGASGNDEDQQVFVTTDEKTAIWTATRESPPLYGIVQAERTTPGAAFGTPKVLLAPSNFAPPFAGKLVFIGEANVTEVPEGWVMYLMCGIAGADADGGKPDDIHIRMCFSRKPR